MSAESPTDEKNIFSYERSTTPPPTTSAYIPKPELIPVEKEKEKDHDGEKEDKDKDKDKDDKDKEDKDGPLGPGSNPGYKKDDAIVNMDKDRKDDRGDGGRDKDDKKCNDQLDGKWVLPPPKNDEEEEDGCVKCLYYSMQCCECTII